MFAKSRFHLTIALLLLLFHTHTALSQIAQSKIENPQFGSLTGELGRSIAVDGKVMAVGAPASSPFGISGSGLVRIYESDDLGDWHYITDLTADDAEAGDAFGWSVAVSGMTVIVSARRDDLTGRPDAGSAYVFVKENGAWIQQAKLTADDGSTNDQFGIAVALSGDRAIIGAWGNSSNTGAAYVFLRSGEVWTQEMKLTAEDGMAGDEFGCSVSISGETAVVGAYYDNDYGTHCGAAYVFELSANTWEQQAKLIGSDTASYDFFGMSVSISNDVIAVGAYGDDSTATDCGSVYVYVRSDVFWFQQSKCVAGDRAAYDAFGRSVSISNDILWVGSDMDDDRGSNSGSAYLFLFVAGSYVQGAKYFPADGAADDNFGRSVAISGDEVVFGSYRDDDARPDCGSAYWARQSMGSWSMLGKLSPVDGAEEDLFGEAVALSGNTAVVGSPSDDPQGLDSGSVFAFTQAEGEWLVQGNIFPADASAGDRFGASVSIDGDGAIIGAPGKDSSGADAGGAYIFGRKDQQWSEDNNLLAADSVAGDQFGKSTAILGDTAVVGAPGCNTGRGAVYVYKKSSTGWEQQAKLSAQDGSVNDHFGGSVALAENTIVIGADGDDDNGPDSGSAYIFTASELGWSELQKIIASEGLPGDHFGGSVAIVGDTLAVGAQSRDGLAIDSGSVYVFARSENVWAEQYICQSDDALRLGRSIALAEDMLVAGALDFDGSGCFHLFTRWKDHWTDELVSVAADASPDDLFGVSVAVQDGTVIAGASKNNGPEVNSGAAYSCEISHRVVFCTDGTQGASLDGQTTQTVQHGDACSAVKALAPEGYRFRKWTRNGETVSTDNPLTLTDISAATRITAVFVMKLETKNWSRYE